MLTEVLLSHDKKLLIIDDDVDLCNLNFSTNLKENKLIRVLDCCDSWSFERNGFKMNIKIYDVIHIKNNTTFRIIKNKTIKQPLIIIISDLCLLSSLSNHLVEK